MPITIFLSAELVFVCDSSNRLVESDLCWNRLDKMDNNNLLKFTDNSRTDSGFESARNSINPSITDSARGESIASTYSSGLSDHRFDDGVDKDDGKTVSLDDGVASMEQLEHSTSKMSLDHSTSKINLDVYDPTYEKIYTHWLVPDAHGNIPLHMAIKRHEFEVAHSIMARCLYNHLLDTPDGAGWTPLAIAARTEQPAMARALVMYGADVTKLCHGNMPLHIAVQMGNDVMVDMLTKPLDIDFLKKNPLMKQLEVEQSYINKTNWQGKTALHLAVEKNHPEIVRLLVKEHGCDVNDRDDRNGDSTLNILMKNGGDLDMLKYLLENDADPNIANYSGYTALHLAASYGHHDVVHVLLNFTTADIAAMGPDEDLAYDLAYNHSVVAHCIAVEMDNRIPTWR